MARTKKAANGEQVRSMFGATIRTAICFVENNTLFGNLDPLRPDIHLLADVLKL